MYNLLLVDDEKIAVDTLYEILQDMDELNLSIFKAYSGTDALNWLDKARIDIVITDVCMPDIDGMELHKLIQGRWPRCKVIFLSGYDNFEYARTAMRNNGVDYIIKTDGDEAVLEAIEKALGQILQEEKNEKLLSDARREFLQYLPVLQKEYVLEILKGEQYNPDEMKSRFKELDIRLDTGMPALILIGHVDDWKEKSYAEKKLDIIYKIQNIVREYLQNSFMIVSAMDSSYDPVWLLQSQDIKPCTEGLAGKYLWNNSIVTLHNTLDSIQNSCGHLAGVKMSFAFSSKPCDWDSIGRKYDELMLLFYTMSYGSGKEMILNDGIIDDSKSAANIERNSSTLFSMRQKIKLVSVMGVYLGNGRSVEFHDSLLNIINAMCSAQEIPPEMNTEIYYSIAMMFQSCINRLGFMQETAKAVDLRKLMRMEDHSSWQEIGIYFNKLAMTIFNLRDNNSHERTNVIVAKIQKYIANNLEKDLSAVTLAELVHLNQSYFSRLYKQATGISLSDYIIKVKIDKAYELLSKNKLKINEIASLLGFTSHACFTRFFRRYTGVSPQDYKSL